MTKQPAEPLGWANWRAHDAGDHLLGAIEAGCYTDASPTGQLETGLGPIQVINTVPADRLLGLANMAIVVRVDVYRQIDAAQISWSRTSVRGFTGAGLGEEFGSLLALALGIRCRSGGMIRNFEPGDDRGQPYEFDHVRPYLPPPRFRRAPILPGMDREVSLEDARDLLARYPKTSWRKAVALVRAARLYEQAIWAAEADPSLSWLLLVSAIETAAAEVHGVSPRGARSHTVRPTRRFIEFLTRYAPSPPAIRPEYGAVDWSQMAKHAHTIYDWRSRALHDGIPFPSPMCLPPREHEGGAYEEAPTGRASATGMTVWKAADTPMLSWTFAYLTRGALLSWWRRTALR